MAWATTPPPRTLSDEDCASILTQMDVRYFGPAAGVSLKEGTLRREAIREIAPEIEPIHEEKPKPTVVRQPTPRPRSHRKCSNGRADHDWSSTRMRGKKLYKRCAKCGTERSTEYPVEEQAA